MTTQLVRHRPAVPVLLATLVTVLLLAVAPPRAEAAPPIALPEPSGRSAVSTETLQLSDPGRTDPWRPDSGARQLVVTMTYPTSNADGPPATYMTPAESRAYLDFTVNERGVEIPADLPRDVLAQVRVPASSGDAVSGPRGSRPLVLLSPGFSLPRSTLTSLATELASRGYVVASVDHVGESSGVQLRDGSLVGCAACEIEDFGVVPRVRADDLSFVIDQLTGARSPWAGSRVIDPSRIASAGHSIGGNASATALTGDPRVDAAVNLDGTFFDPVQGEVGKPFLMIGTRELHTPSGPDETWPRDWARFTGPRYWLTVDGSNHGSFTDVPLVTEQAVGDPGSELGGQRSVSLTRAYVGAFVDTHLRGRPEPGLLRGPSTSRPEVAFHDPSRS